MYEFIWTDRDDRAVALARALSADAVQKAGNGHPGTPISLAPVAHLLYQKVMAVDPGDPHWIGRDRFVLSVPGSRWRSEWRWRCGVNMPCTIRTPPKETVSSTMTSSSSPGKAVFRKVSRRRPPRWPGG